MGANTAIQPEKTGTSSVSVLPASTLTVRLIDPALVTNVRTRRPTATLCSVTGDSPAGSPSSSTLAPAGCVSMTIVPVGAGGGATTGGGAAASRAAGFADADGADTSGR